MARESMHGSVSTGRPPGDWKQLGILRPELGSSRVQAGLGAASPQTGGRDSHRPAPCFRHKYVKVPRCGRCDIVLGQVARG